MILGALLFSLALSPELPVSTATNVPAWGAQAQPQVASDGTNFLVAWRDNRHQDNYGSIWATRVAPDGRMLDLPTGIPIFSSTYPPPTSSTNAAPAVVWTGSSWLVLWTEANPNQLELRRVDSDGRLLDAAPRTIDAGMVVPGAIAAVGGRELLTYLSPTAGLAARLLDENGVPVGDPIALRRSVGDINPVVASNGRSFLIAWWHFDTFPYVAIAPVSRDGAVGAIRYIPTKSMPVLASNGSDFLLVYAGNSGALLTEHLDDQGRTIGQHVLLNKPILPFTGIAATADGNGYLLSIPGSEQTVHPVSGVELTADGVPVGEPQLTADGTAEGSVALATNGTNVLAAYRRTTVGDGDVYSRIVNDPAGDTLLSRSAAVQRFVRTATDGSHTLAVWNETGSIRAGIVGAAGAGTLVSDNANFSAPPAVTFDGANYVVAWLTATPYDQIAFARIAPDGSLVDPVPQTVSHAVADAVALSSDGHESLLAWAAPGANSIMALRLGRDGTQLDAPQQIASGNNAEDHPQIAWNGAVWLVVWEEVLPAPNSCNVCLVPPPPPTHDVHAARVTPSMQLLDPVPIVVAGTGNDEAQPAVGSNGTDFVVAWSESPLPGTLIRARHVAANGTQSGVTDLSSGTNPAVAARGSDYVVAWADAGSYLWSLLSEPLRLTIAPNGDYLVSVSLLGSTNGVLAAYHRIDDDPAAGSIPRAFVRALTVRSRGRVGGR